MAKTSGLKSKKLSDKDFRRAFDKYIKEYFENRSLSGLQTCLSTEVSGIGTALNEIAFNYPEAISLFKSDLEQISAPIRLVTPKFELQRLNENLAVIFGFCKLHGQNGDQEFEISNFRMTAVLTVDAGEIKIAHLHCSLPQYDPGEPQSFPLRLLKTSLHETSEKFRLIFENAPVGIIHFDDNGVVKECNRKFVQIMNSTAEKIIGMKMLELEDQQAVNAVKSALCGKNGFYEGYYRAVTSGKLVPLKAMLTPIFGSDASINGGLGIYEDIGESKIAESRLHYQFQFEKIIATISSSFVNAKLEDVDNVIVNALKLTARFFNAERAYVFQINQDNNTARGTHEWEEPGVPSILHKYTNISLDGMSGVLERLSNFIHIPDITKYPAELEPVRNILTAGEVCSVLVLPLIYENEIIGCFGYDCIHNHRSWSYEEITLLKVVGEIFANIFAKQAAEARLHESEEKYRLLAENASDVIWIADVNSNSFSYVSPSAEKVFGMTAAEIAAEPLTGRLSKEAAEFFLKAAEERVPGVSIEPGSTFIDEAFQVHKDGRLIPTEVTTTWIKAPTTGHTLIIGVTRDITLRKQAEEQRALLEMQKLQNQKADSLGRMAGAIAHHFNNQLQVVLGNLELLNAELLANPILKKRLSDALRATNKAAELSSLMLSYLGQTQSSVERIDLVQACQVQHPLLHELCSESIDLKLDCHENNLYVNADPAHLQQILRNVVTNSVEAIGENQKGKIQITLKTVRAQQITPQYRFPTEWRPSSETYACIEITDDGCGIEAGDLDRIFDPFYSSKFTGRGLGLAVSLGFMRSMGGAVSFRSKPGKGTTFSFYFNLNTQSPEIVIGKDSRLSRKVVDGSVLLIEDEEMVRFITSNLLEHYNFQVLEAKSGEEGVEIFTKNKDSIKLVICDLVMPGIDGWHTLEKIKEINPDIPIILASGYDQSYVMKSPQKIMPDAFLSKPYGAKALQQAIKEAFSKD